MPNYLYDTTLFIDYWKGIPAALVLIDDARQGKTVASYSPISATELWQYPLLNRREEIEFFAMGLFLKEAALTTKVATRAGTWLRAYRRNQRRLLAADALIASTASERGETIITRNTRHLKKFYSNVVSY